MRRAGAPEQHDQRAETVAVRAVADRAHDRDDLFNRRRIGREARDQGTPQDVVVTIDLSC
jgi:hypothetical protein